MFTGIIEELGTVVAIDAINSRKLLKVISSKLYRRLLLGDSVAINGVCLTLVERNKNEMLFDVVEETLLCTNIDNLGIKEKVNLESAVKANDRLSGHVVQGHIDTTAKISNIVKYDDSAAIFKIEIDSEWMKYCIIKGSIAIDGISLTIANMEDNIISVSIIPHTMENTNLQFREINDIVNIETDMFGKYIERLLKYDEEEIGV